MPKAYWGEIKDPVHGYFYITENEKKIIDSYPMQRLRRLRQLAGSEYVYPGANHTRFEHCMGVMFLAGKVAENPHLSQIAKSETSDKISKMGFKPEEVAQLAVGKLRKPGKAFWDQIISSAVDVDKQDFIVRDTYHTGAEYGFIAVFRLIHALEV